MIKDGQNKSLGKSRAKSTFFLKMYYPKNIGWGLWKLWIRAKKSYWDIPKIHLWIISKSMNINAELQKVRLLQLFIHLQ